MIIKNESLDCFVLLIYHKDHLTDAILVLDTNPVPIQEMTKLHDTLLQIDLHQEQDILGILDPTLALTQETKQNSKNSITKRSHQI